jgi:hypothetical protein
MERQAEPQIESSADSCNERARNDMPRKNAIIDLTCSGSSIHGVVSRSRSQILDRNLPSHEPECLHERSLSHVGFGETDIPSVIDQYARKDS